MLKKELMSFFTSLLQKTATLRNISILFILSQLVFLSMMLLTFPKINAQIGTNAFDLRTFGYSQAIAESIVAKLTIETRQLYLFPQLALLDVVYPILLALFLSSLLYRLVPKNQGHRSILLILPFMALCFDYIENICIALLITKSIPTSTSFVFFSSLCTILKGVFTTLSWIIILIIFAIRFIAFVRNKHTRRLKNPS